MTEMATPKLLPPHYFAAALLLIIVSHWLPGPRLGIGQPAGLIAGVALLVFCMALAASGSGQFRRADTNIIPFSKASVLVTDGVFRWSRNPMYLGMLVALLGATLLTQSLWAALLLVAFFWLIQSKFVRHEERQMQAEFGAAYEQYCARTRRWL